MTLRSSAAPSPGKGEIVAEADASGRYAFERVTPGAYTLSVEASGFLTIKRAITISIAESVNVSLELAPVGGDVNVTDSAADLAIESTFKISESLREVPRAVTVIDSERIRAQNFRQVPDALAYTPGITANSYRTGGYHFYARGYRMSPEDTRVDGFAGINAGGGYGASLFGVEQAVLLRGPAGLLYGSSSAPGGFINLVTKKPRVDRSTQLDVRSSSYAGNGVRVADRPSIAFDLDSTGSLTKSDRVLYRTLFTVENQNYFTNDVLDRNRYANGSLTFRLDDEGRYALTPLAQWTRFNRPAGGGIVVSPSSSLSANDGIDRLTNTDDISRPDVNLFAGGRIDETLSTGFDFRGAPTDRLRVSAAYRYIDFEYFVNQFAPQVTSAAQLNQLRNASTVARVQSKSDNSQRNHSYDLNATYELRAAGWWRNTTQVGVYNRYLTTRTTSPVGTISAASSRINVYTGATSSALVDNFPTLRWNDASDTSYLNTYAQNRTSLANNRWIVTLGLGYGRNTVNDADRKGALLPNAGLVFNATERLALYGSYSESFSPNDTALEDITGGRDAFPATKGINYEVGAKFDVIDRKLSSTLSLFHNTVDNALVQSGALDLNPNGNRYYIEAGTRRSRGVELTVNARPLPFWNIDAAASFLDAIYTGEGPASARATLAIPGSRAEKSPRWSYSFWNRYDRNEGIFRGFGGGLGVVWQDERLGGNGARTFAAPDPLILPAFTRVDAAIYYRYNESLDFSVNVENVFDRLIFVGGAVASALEIAAPRQVTFRTGYRF